MKRLVLIVFLLLTAASAFGVAVQADEPAACPDGLVLIQVGEISVCSHGDDAPPRGEDRSVDNDPRILSFADKVGVAEPVECIGDGQSGHRIEVLYVYTATTGNRIAEYRESFRQWAADADQIYNESAKRTGGSRNMRFVTDANCRPVVTDIQLTNVDVASMNNTINALYQKGYNRTDRKYLIFADANVYCGIGTLMPDDDKSAQANQNNLVPGWARVDAGCWSGFVAAHELTHNLGGVQNSAPNHTEYGHCTDDMDVMCYNDGPGTVMRRVCILATDENLLDCQNDDYFNTNPLAGTYLSENWNVADSPYLISMPVPPDPSQPSCQLDKMTVWLREVITVRCVNLEPGDTVVARWINYRKDKTFTGTAGEDGIAFLRVKVIGKLGTGGEILRVTAKETGFTEDITVNIYTR